MSQIGGPIQSGLAGGVPAQDIASRSRAKRERERAEKTRRFEDAVNLTVPGMESPEAIHGLSEHDEEEHQKRKEQHEAAKQEAATPKPTNDDDTPHIDLHG